MGRWLCHGGHCTPYQRWGALPYRLSEAREQHGLERLTPFVSAPQGLSLLTNGNQPVNSRSAATPPLHTSPHVGP